MTTRFDLDPAISKVCAIAITLFLESFLGSLIVILTQERIPTIVELALLLCIALLVLTTYILTFLRTGESQTGETS